MKLVEILARELKEWPEGYVFIQQFSTGALIISKHDARDSYVSGQIELASDWGKACVSRTKWEAERARIALSDHMDEALDAGLTASGDRFLKGSGNSAKELAAIACGKRSKEDQEIWDKVAISAIGSILQKEYVRGVEYKLIASECFEFADMFMAERAKRMK